MIDTDAIRKELNDEYFGHPAGVAANIAEEALDHIDAQAEENKHLQEVNTVIKDDQGPIVAVNIKLQEEIERLREALDYYADRKNYEPIDDRDIEEVIFDCGDKARAALKPDTEEGET